LEFGLFSALSAASNLQLEAVPYIPQPGFLRPCAASSVRTRRYYDLKGAKEKALHVAGIKAKASSN